MVLSKRYCVEYIDGTIECFREGFWYTGTGLIVKWSILAGFFLFFTLWFLGGYMHAKQRLRKGKPLLSYHRWLVSYQDRKKFGQTPQNDFTFYAAQPYGQPFHPQHQYQQPQQPQQRADGTWPEPPPMYTPGKSEQPADMSMYGAPPQYPPPPGPPPMGPPPMGQQQTGVVGANGDLEGQQQAQLPPRPQKAAVKTLLSKFRK
ncbi:hypothetical protein P280DRAFT_474235 [Massarina eburnea CBS 473.64]|uniref:Ubiquitin-protein ligase sel1 n=1 Tax=Massarina eburnea CBS 473.64 TaxID=1395130 RepID=A0A6A6RHG9_9PLEO|nr:hypothetical protein P280DRAFT_474235 [Massarina eburnea CBS 473.64]